MTSFIIGAAIAKNINIASLILLAGAMSFFLARTPFLSALRLALSSKHTERAFTPPLRPGLVRRCGTNAGAGFTHQAGWSALYSLIGILSFLFLFFRYKLTAIGIFAALSVAIFSYNIYHTYKKGVRAREAGISGVLGVSFLSSFGYYTASGRFDSVVATLWILVFLYLAGGIFYVEARLGVFKWHSCFIFHIITIIIVIMLSILKLIPTLTIVSYLPAFIKSSTIDSISTKSISAIRRIGRIELLHSIIFATILMLIYLAR